jgi:hypothetical protein
VASITTFDGDLDEARAPQSIALTLEDELDISRGDLLAGMGVAGEHQPKHATAIEASLVWFDGTRLESHKPYLLKHGTQTVIARVTRVLDRTNILTLEREAVHTLGMNDIGAVEIAVTRPLFFDAYAENRATGSFILIDAGTNATMAAGMIRRGVDEGEVRGQKAALLRIRDRAQADALEELLLDAGVVAVRTRVADPKIWQALLGIGVVTIVDGVETAECAVALGDQFTSAEVLDDRVFQPAELMDQLRLLGILPEQKGRER